MTKTESHVAIVIVNWNNAVETIDCVRSLMNISYSGYSIIIVDNGSTNDDATDLYHEFGDNVMLLRSEANLGFAGGTNIGLSYAMAHDAEFILMINNDTIVEPNFLKPLVESFSQTEGCGMTTPKICFFAEPEKIWSAGGHISRVRASGFTRGEGHSRERYSARERVTFATGCCVLLSCKVIRDIGLWDESYFLYVEDAEYSHRLTSRGYNIVYVGDSVIYHKVNRSTRQVNELLPLYYSTRNRLLFKDTLGLVYSTIASLYLWCVFALKCAWWRVSRQRSKSNAVLKAAADYLAGRTGFRHIANNEFKETDS